MGHPLRSGSITDRSSLLQNAPPLCPASVLSRLPLERLARLPWHRDDRFSRSPQAPGVRSRHALRRLPSGQLHRSLPDSSRGKTEPRFRQQMIHSRRLIARFACARLLDTTSDADLPHLFPDRSLHEALNPRSIGAIYRLPLHGRR